MNGDEWGTRIKTMYEPYIDRDGCGTLIMALLCSRYFQVRKQFGKPLSETQHNQFQLAQMATKLVASRYRWPASLLVQVPVQVQMTD